MSPQALTRAFSAPVNPSAAKFIFVALANYADENGHCYPGQVRLAKDTGQSERSVRRHLAMLEEQGWIVRSRRQRKNGSRTSDAFDLQWQPRKPPDRPVDARPSGQSDQTKRPICPNQPANLSGPEPSEEPSELNTGSASADPRAPALPTLGGLCTNLKSQLFGTCLHFLSRKTGRPPDKLRSMVGRWCRDHGDGRVLEAFQQAARADPIEPVSWMEERLNGSATKRPSRTAAAIAGIRGYETRG